MENIVLVIMIVLLSSLDLVLTLQIFGLAPSTAIELNPLYGDNADLEDVLHRGVLYRLVLIFVLVSVLVFVPPHSVLMKGLYTIMGYQVSVCLKNLFVLMKVRGR